MTTFKKFIQEAFYDFVKSAYPNDPDPVEIYKNPTTTEIKKLQKIASVLEPNVRMVLYKKDAYAWAASEGDHADMTHILRIPLKDCVSLVVNIKSSGKLKFRIAASTHDFNTPASKKERELLIKEVKKHPYLLKMDKDPDVKLQKDMFD